jgi:hypothetical protein
MAGGVVGENAEIRATLKRSSEGEIGVKKASLAWQGSSRGRGALSLTGPRARIFEVPQKPQPAPTTMSKRPRFSWEDVAVWFIVLITGSPK